MWARFRRWRHALVLPVSTALWVCLVLTPTDSALQYACVAVVGVGVVAYVAEEVVWRVWAGGRPCPSCNHSARARSFAVVVTCPNCGAAL